MTLGDQEGYKFYNKCHDAFSQDRGESCAEEVG